MEQVVIFTGDAFQVESLTKEINSWLQEKDDGTNVLTIKHISQSSSASGLQITLFYELSALVIEDYSKPDNCVGHNYVREHRQTSAEWSAAASRDLG